MSHIDRHQPGSFCWFELATSDQHAAKTFYSSLFGWSHEDSPMGPGEVYTMFNLEGRNCAATYTSKQEGVPPHWMIYVEVESADSTAAKAKELGGTVLAGPFDVFSFGRMCAIQDPTGAVFSIWQSKDHTGTRIERVAGTVCWADCSTTDQAKATEFYGALFGWKFPTGNDDYLHIENAGKMIGGVPSPAQRDPNVPPHWDLYFEVKDVDVTAAKAVEGGAKVLFGPVTMEGVGRMAFVSDPQGAVFALFRGVNAKS